MPSMLRSYALAAPDPALTSLWLVQIDNASAVTYLLAEQMSATFPKIPAQSRFTSGTVRHYPGMQDIDQIAITFYESHDYKVTQWLKTWTNQVKDDNGNFGLPVTYKRNIVLNMFSKASTQPVHVVTYGGCWPTDKGAFELNYSDETGRMVIQANFSVDTVTY